MASLFHMFESASNPEIEFSEECPLGLFVEGINDFPSFSNQIHQSFGQNTQIVQISSSISFISLNTNFREFIKDSKRKSILSHYIISSIFLNQSFYDEIINKCDEITTIQDLSAFPQEDFHTNFYYLCFPKTSFTPDYHEIPNLQDVKISSSSKLIFYGFKLFSDLVNSYIILLKTLSNWPIFALLPSFFIKLQKHLESERHLTQEITKFRNILLTQKNKTTFPQFVPENNLFYLGFIEPNVEQHQKIQNVDEKYSIRNIIDCQINYVYNEKGKDETTRTFLGFDTEFRCLQAFDYLLYLSKKKSSFSDVILINVQKHDSFNVHYDLFYIEIPYNSGFDSSLFNSFSYTESLDNKSSNFYGFNNYRDFKKAKKSLVSSLDDSTLIKDVRCVNYSEISERFDDRVALNMKKSRFHFLVFKLKGELSKLKSYLKGNKLIEKDVNFKKNLNASKAKKYVLVGFNDAEVRNKALSSLRNSQYTSPIKFYYPEDMHIRSDIYSKDEEGSEQDEVTIQADSQQTDKATTTDTNDDTKNEQESTTSDRNQAYNRKGKGNSRKNKGKNANKQRQQQTQSFNTNNTIDNNITKNAPTSTSKSYNLNTTTISKPTATSNASIAHAKSANLPTTTTNKANAPVSATKSATFSTPSSTSNTPTATATTTTTSSGTGSANISSSPSGGSKKNKKNKKNAEQAEPKSPESTIFTPNQDLIYLYFVEKEKARKISQGKENLSLFGVKKCKEVQRYRKMPDSDAKDLYTFLGFSKFDDTQAGVNLIKSKWLADGQVKIYELTQAFEKHQNPNDSEYDEIEDLLIQAMDNQTRNQSLSLSDKKYNINTVKIRDYKSFIPDNDDYYSFNQLSVGNDVQSEIKSSLNRLKAFKSFQKDLITHDSYLEPHTVFYLNFRDDSTDEALKKALENKSIEYFDPEAVENIGVCNFLKFDERLIPDNVIEHFINFISIILGVYEVKRNVFYRDSIVTMVFYEDITEDYLLMLLEQFLDQENCLFDKAKYPLKNTIYLKHEIILLYESNFKALASELEKVGPKPISVIENKLLFFKQAINNNFIQRYSYICFKNQQDKMNALNHLNEVLYKGKNNVLKYNPSLFYIKYDPAIFTFDNGFSSFIDEIEGVVDLQENVLSIENPIELTYIGFDSFNLLNKASYLLFSLSKEPDDIDDDFLDDEKFFNGEQNDFITENLSSF